MTTPRTILFLTAPELPRRSHSAVLPPLANLVLTGALRRAGYLVTRHDLDARLVGRPDLLAPLEALSPEDVRGYCAGRGAAAAIDAALDWLLAGVELAGVDVVAISSKRPFGAQLLATRVHRASPAPIIVGGDLDNDPAGLLESTPAVDAVVSGRGQVPLLAYLEVLAGRRARAEVPGLWFRRAGAVAHNDSVDLRIEEEAAPDARDLATGDYLLQPALLDHPPNPGLKLVVPYYFIEGCPFGCSYCRALQHRVRLKPPAQVVHEVAALAESTGSRDVAFFNNTVNVSSRMVRELAAALTAARLGLRWSDSATFVRSNAADLAALRESGCICLTFGLESAAPRILRLMRKPHTPATAEEVLRRSDELGIWNRVNVMVGFPGETDADFEETARFIERNAGRIDALAISSFYLVDSDVLRSPARYGIRVRDFAIQPGRGHILGAWRFDEVGGPAWEEREHVSAARAGRLKATFQGAGGGARDLTNLNEVHDAYSYCASKEDIRARLRARRGLRLVLFVGTACNNRCADCPARALAPWSATRTTERLVSEIDTARAAGYTRVVLVGGEPTIRRDLPALLAHLQERRFEQIELVTNGRMLAYGGLARLLRRHHVQLTVKLHGADAAAHDAAVGVAGAHAQTRSGLRHWRAVGGSARTVEGAVLGRRGSWAGDLG